MDRYAAIARQLAHVSDDELVRWLAGAYEYYERERGTPDGPGRIAQIQLLESVLKRRGVRTAVRTGV